MRENGETTCVHCYLVNVYSLLSRGVRDTGISMVPWESHENGKHRLNSWEWEWWTGNGREMGIVVWKKFP